MATTLVNRAFPKIRVDLYGSNPKGLIVGFVAPGNITNQQWSFPSISGQQGFVNVKSAASGGAVAGAYEGEVPENPPPNFEFQGIVVGGGPVNDFVIEVVNGGIMICLPGEGKRPDLYWTLVNGLRVTPVRLMVRNDKAPNTQIWNLKAVV